VWLASIRLVRLVHQRLFTFEKRRVSALRTRDKGRQSYHYDQSRSFLEEVEEAVVRWMAYNPKYFGHTMEMYVVGWRWIQRSQ
jgi:hypothetical protein